MGKIPWTLWKMNKNPSYLPSANDLTLQDDEQNRGVLKSCLLKLNYVKLSVLLLVL